MRLYNWEARLSSYLVRVAREGFGWGRHDCALFAAGGVEAVTGRDPAAPWRGRYATRREGMRLIRAAGHADHVAAAAALLPEVPAAMVLPGDLAVLPGVDGQPALGIVQGALVYVLRAEGPGLGLVPIGRADRILGVR
ncbi:DUF6950 family protein [Paracoccus sanguinis]|uniref:DUF6950 domain-containing protein n=1 Tax=Paracoccus sanguinis TaxID=1545044 RepID=A0A1H2SSD5_9RHOB|nr:hypothetical protein [Paracoccus sanguinis]KGJ19303.1 hypothetical protein IX57_00105 [Paracoccus sanguinis]SDW34437.1 hypothetical protein SAMN05444276_101713 [Paracoccus sanguinis]